MNNQYNKYIIAFLCSILLLLPISNGLHFILVDHSQTISTKKDKNFPHNCDDYTFNPTYTAFNSLEEVEKPIWNDDIILYETFYGYNYTYLYSVGIKNKGPPNEENI